MWGRILNRKKKYLCIKL
uniref:Uncharacterized protein n=1 Tax=Rhizophora mucronata TaxID=61149 RepID=A0A2P2PEZ5_RHIMU